MAAPTWTRAKMHASPPVARVAKMRVSGQLQCCGRVFAASVLPATFSPTIRSNVKGGFGHKKSLSSIDKAPPSVLAILFLRPIPFHLLPLHYAPFSPLLQFVRRFLGFQFSTLSGFEFPATAEFSREGRTSRVAPSGSTCVPFRTSVRSLRSSSIDSQFKRTVGLDYSLIKFH